MAGQPLQVIAYATEVKLKTMTYRYETYTVLYLQLFANSYC